MNDTIDGSNFVLTAYSIRQQSVIINIYSMLHKQNLLSELNNILISYFDQFNPPLDYQDIKPGFEGIIFSYVTDEVLVPKLSIVPNKYGSGSLLFIAGLLEFINDYTNPTAIKILENRDILTNVDMEPEHIIGTLVNSYYPEYEAVLGYDDIVTITDDALDVMVVALDKIIESSQADHNLISEITTSLLEVSPDLMRSKLFNYVVTNNAYDLTGQQMLSYIDSLLSTGILTPVILGKELVVYGVLTDTGKEQVIELINDVYGELDTMLLVNYVSKYLIATDV